VDRPTVDIYEQVAADYAARRQPSARAEAGAFAVRVPNGGLRADLGCGPGRYTADLGSPLVALDAARAMLDLVTERAPGAMPVQADLEALPFRPRSLAGAWANLSYQHLPRQRLPLALAQLHAVLAVGAVAEITLFSGDGEGPLANDDFPGRFFALWSAADLARVFEGAGFSVESITADTDQLRARLVRRRSLPDFVGPDMRLLLCGLNPSNYAADTGVNFARAGNRFWPAALAAGIASVDRDPAAALALHGTGLTDLVKRATTRAAAVSTAEYVAGAHRLQWMVAWLQPRALCFVGLAGWRAVIDRHAQPGPQPQPFAGVPVYVMPSTSGLNARSSLADLTTHLRAAATVGR
jgi:TDG/mug DNA glycosylase family protein